jgi:hypothetical protein
MAEPKGSLRHVRRYVNQAQDQLDAALFTGSPSLAAAASGGPDWVSPLESDGYLECWNERFLERLGIPERLSEFSAFWPFKAQTQGVIREAGTPHWDALARIGLAGDGGTVPGAVMVEAKAHRGELLKLTDASGATPASLDKIKASFATARDYLGVPVSAPAWESHHYQVCNRLAHLYWMNVVAKMPTWLVWVFIVDDPVWPDRLSAWEWHQTFEQVGAAAGLPPDNPLADKITAVYLPASP